VIIARIFDPICGDDHPYITRSARPALSVISGAVTRRHRKTSGSCSGRLLSDLRLDLEFQRGDNGGVRLAPGKDALGVGDAPRFLDVQQAQFSRVSSTRVMVVGPFPEPVAAADRSA
jgi:hypothetical protein